MTKAEVEKLRERLWANIEQYGRDMERCYDTFGSAYTFSNGARIGIWEALQELDIVLGLRSPRRFSRAKR